MLSPAQNGPERHLISNVTGIATTLGDEGKKFNQHLVRQFKGWDSVRMEDLPHTGRLIPEHLIFLKAIAQSLNWLQQLIPAHEDEKVEETANAGAVPVIYLRVLLEAKTGRVNNVAQRLEELLEQGQREAGIRKPRRLLAVLAGLETWSRVKLPDVSPNGLLDLEELQRLALSACGRARWTALAPLKMYAIYKLSQSVHLPIPRGIFPPMGSAVSRAIERLFGFALRESENDYSISRGLHVKLADLAQTTIFEINSGLYRLGGGV